MRIRDERWNSGHTYVTTAFNGVILNIRLDGRVWESYVAGIHVVTPKHVVRLV